MSNELAVLLVGLVVVLFIGKSVEGQARKGGCGGIIAAVLTIVIIALGALYFAH